MVRGGRRRQVSKRSLARRILVVTEGTCTEPQYVERLGSYLRSRGSTVLVKPVAVGKDPLKVVQKCIEQRDADSERGKGYDDCVCLVDVDNHASLPAAIQLAKKESILLLISNLKFEVWLRWHAESKRSALSSKQLDKIVAQLELVQGKQLSPAFPIENVDEACAIAHQADPDLCADRQGPDPSTALPILVELMRGDTPPKFT